MFVYLDIDELSPVGNSEVSIMNFFQYKAT